TLVTVREGAVRVRDATGIERLLRAGDQAVIEERPQFILARTTETHLASVAPASVASWTRGRLTYNDVRLSELIADLNRYYPPGIEIASDRARELRVTTSLKTDEIEGFLDELGQVVPVSSTRTPGGRYRIQAAPSR